MSLVQRTNRTASVDVLQLGYPLVISNRWQAAGLAIDNMDAEETA